MIESKIFQTVLFKLRSSGFLADNNWSSKFVLIRILIVVSVNVWIYTCAPLWFILYEGKAFDERTESFFFLSNGITTLILHYILIHQRPAFLQSITTLEGIIQKRPDPTRAIYSATKEKIEKWTNFCYRIVFRGAIPIFILQNVIVSIIKLFSNDYSTESYHLPYAASFFFDWRSPVGYVTAIAMQSVAIILSVNIYVSLLFFYFGICIFSVTFTTDIELNLHASTGQLKTNRSRIGILEFKRKLNEIWQFHSDARSFVCDFSNIFSNVIILFFSYGTITICCMLLLILVSINSGHRFDIVHACVPLIVVVKWIYFYCYLGDNVTSRFGQLDEIIYQCEWFLYPIDVQKDLVLAMAIAQKPVFMHGFANIHCTKIIFKKIVNAGFSYFMVLRQYSH